MLKFEDFWQKSDEELIRYLAEHGGSPSGSIAGGEQEHERETIKAVLHSRSGKLVQNQNKIMIGLTRAVAVLTFFILLLTAVLVWIALRNPSGHH